MDNRLAGKRIAALRQARGLTQQQLAAMMSVSHQAVSKWESGLALPDIQTMLELTRFFGITVEQLFAEENPTAATVEPEISTEEINETKPEPEKEEKKMTIQQLLQMAPFMSKAAVEEIAMMIEEPITAAQMAKLAPFVSSEALGKLIEKNKPQFSWDNLRKIAPFMDREQVDALARAIVSGEETVKDTGDCINKTFSDLGKAFDHLGKDMGQAFDDIGREAKRGVKKAIRFGGKVINKVSEAINDLAEDDQKAEATVKRSEKAVAIRKRAFERAMADGRWDWIGAHIQEVEDDAELKNRIATQARLLEMHDWICQYMGGYADESTVRAAIASGNWDWLGDNAWQLDHDMQQEVAVAAKDAANWKWLEDYSDQLELKDCGVEIARAALAAGEKVLAAQIANHQLTQPEAAELAGEACDAADYDSLELLLDAAGKDFLDAVLVQFAEKGEWELVFRFAKEACTETVEKLMELAVDQGNFDAVDLLDVYL